MFFQFEVYSTEAQTQTMLRAIADFTVDSTQKIEELVKEIVTWVQ
ncbi:hypothetical protein NIES4103_24400 [Nostoc sp. NIES-4103]|nr:hypothetical protein NIES4103_24400 [Nostoc sp. NIES-4103]